MKLADADGWFALAVLNSKAFEFLLHFTDPFDREADAVGDVEVEIGAFIDDARHALDLVRGHACGSRARVDGPRGVAGRYHAHLVP